VSILHKVQREFETLSTVRRFIRDTMGLGLGIVLLCLFVMGCNPNRNVIEVTSLPVKNPTVYDFNASLEQVKKAISEARGTNWQFDAGLQHVDQVLSWKEDDNPFAKKIYAKSENGNDAFIWGMANTIGKSQVYSKDGKELEYYADFHLHLVALNPTKIRVEVFTYNNYVKAGTEWHPQAQAGIHLVVPPSSIEEYQILLDVGKELGEKDMPKLIVPAPGAAKQSLKMPDLR
jgi:hypothetical protein